MADSKPFEIRTSLLQLARDILVENAHMRMETSKTQGTSEEWPSVTTDQVIAEAEKLYAFVAKR
jgi:hypothetical protein